MSKKKVGIIGRFFTDGATACDGQVIKTLEIVRSLEETYGKESVYELSYHKIKFNKVKLFVAFTKALKNSEKIVLCARGEALPNLVKALLMLNKFFHRPIYYVLVGGALPKTIEDFPALKPLLSKVEGIYVETDVLVEQLKADGVNNAYVLPNYKHMHLYTEDELKPFGEPPYRLVYMSRVAEQKGVGEMVEALKRINAEKIKYTLDMYGYINPEYEEEFANIQKDFPEYIKYHGIANAWETTDIMFGSFVQLFPTKCATEGQPASVIDSYFAGVPVISGRWNSCTEMIDEGNTGISFPLCEFDKFEQILIDLYDHPEKVEAMRPKCIAEAQKFLPEKAVAPLIQDLNIEVSK